MIMIGGIKMKYCSNCKEYVSSYFYKFCPYCGYRFDSADEFKKNYELGVKYFYGVGVDKDFEKSFYWFMKSAEQGYDKAQYRVGEMYFNGKGVEEDLEEAFTWYMSAAEQGHADAQYKVGTYYDCGIVGEMDFEEAFTWYMKAAEQGHINAQYEVGYAYHYVKGVKEDLEKAFAWCMKAAEQGHADAQNEIGEMYYNGEGVEEDFEKAFFWYMKAAEQGHADAQYSIGYMFYNGVGIEENREEAVTWFKKAVENGNEEAIAFLKKDYEWNEDSILYVYRRTISCKKEHHNIISATAILLGKWEREIRLTVNYCRDCHKFFINESAYNSYREKYGILLGRIEFEKGGNRRGKANWAKESPLMLCGYNVNAQKGLTAVERHYIISKLIDKDIMTKTEITDYLNLFIDLNGQRDSNARAVRKWQNDLAFTLQYKEKEQIEKPVIGIKKWPGKK